MTCFGMTAAYDKQTVRCSRGWNIRGYSYHLRTWLKESLRKADDENARASNTKQT